MWQENVVAQQTRSEDPGSGLPLSTMGRREFKTGLLVARKRIRSLREGAGMWQARLAELVLVSRQTVINWEKGRTLPDAESLKRLSAAFGITLDALENVRRSTCAKPRAIEEQSRSQSRSISSGC